MWYVCTARPKVDMTPAASLPGSTKEHRPKQEAPTTYTHTHIHNPPIEWLSGWLANEDSIEDLCLCLVEGGGLGVPAGLSWDSQSRVKDTLRELQLTGPTLKHSTGWKGQTGWDQKSKVQNIGMFWFYFFSCFMQQTITCFKFSSKTQHVYFWLQSCVT